MMQAEMPLENLLIHLLGNAANFISRNCIAKHLDKLLKLTLTDFGEFRSHLIRVVGADENFAHQRDLYVYCQADCQVIHLLKCKVLIISTRKGWDSNPR